jgi:hypothetical protein
MREVLLGIIGPGFGERGRPARRVWRLAKRIEVEQTYHKPITQLVLEPVGGTPTGGDRDGRATLFELHRYG